MYQIFILVGIYYLHNRIGIVISEYIMTVTLIFLLILFTLLHWNITLRLDFNIIIPHKTIYIDILSIQ